MSKATQSHVSQSIHCVHASFCISNFEKQSLLCNSVDTIPACVNGKLTAEMSTRRVMNPLHVPFFFSVFLGIFDSFKLPGSFCAIFSKNMRCRHSLCLTNSTGSMLDLDPLLLWGATSFAEIGTQWVTGKQTYLSWSKGWDVVTR